MLYTEKYIEEKIKKDNNLNILLENQKKYLKESMKVSFQKYFIERNIQIITQEVENNEKHIIPNLFSISSLHISEKSLCTFKSSSSLSTEDTIQKNNNNINEKQNNNFNQFFNKISKTEAYDCFENKLNKFPNKIGNKSLLILICLKIFIKIIKQKEKNIYEIC